ncbi:hypothetical protein MRX96_017944 [Rhipicephalus microplus]
MGQTRYVASDVAHSTGRHESSDRPDAKQEQTALLLGSRVDLRRALRPPFCVRPHFSCPLERRLCAPLFGLQRSRLAHPLGCGRPTREKERLTDRPCPGHI